MFVHTFLVTCALEFLVSADNSWSIGDTRVIKPNEQENVLSDYHGIVQVYTDVGWYTACTDGLTSESATVACRQMNYIGAVNYSGCPDFKPSPDNSGYLSNIKCDSIDEGNLLRCPHSAIQDGCTPLYVFCKDTRIWHNAYNGQVFINETITGSFYQSQGGLMMSIDGKSLPICNVNSSHILNEASSACRQIGYSKALTIDLIQNPYKNCWELKPIATTDGTTCTQRSQSCFTSCFTDPKESTSDNIYKIVCAFDFNSPEYAGNKTVCVRKHWNPISGDQNESVGWIVAVIIVGVALLMVLVLVVVCITKKHKRKCGHTYTCANEKEPLVKREVPVVCAEAAHIN